MFVVHRARLIIKFIASFFLTCCLILHVEAVSKRKPSCFRGSFNKAGICVCHKGWYGKECQFGRQRLTASEGIISDVPEKYGYSSKCLWLIEAKRRNSTIQLSVDQFWSTSPWYTLYIYNGSSFRAPLLAAFSGIKNENCTAQSLTVWIRTSSRSVLIYFFRDSNNINSGFQLKYSVNNNCSWSCSNHGFCYDGGKCLCDLGWTGVHCNSRICPYACVYGACNTSTWQCDCELGYSGQSCNISSQHAMWTNHVAANQDIAQSRIAAGAGIIGNWLWLYGGLILANRTLNKIIRYSFSRNIWQLVSISNSSIDGPNIKYGHSLIVYNKLLIIFGGVTDIDTTANIPWSFNTSTRHWTILRQSGDGPLAVAGHTATLINNTMIVIFGYGPLGFTNKVQVYDLVTSRWKILNTTSKQGTYGHTSHYDPVTQLIYVHGGRLKTGYSDALYAYNLTTNHWTYLSGSKFPRFLHSSVLIGNMLLVFGGKVFTDDRITKCPKNSFMVYDITCNKWNIVSQGIHTQSAGFGHSAVVYNSKLYIFGGFNGVVKNNIMSYSLGDCSLWKDRPSCTSAYRMSGCLWNPSMNTCINPEEGYSTLKALEKPSCEEKCSNILTCGACNTPGLKCKWCDNTCKKSTDSCRELPVQQCKFPSTCKEGTKCQHQIARCKPYQDCKYCYKCLEMTGNNQGSKDHMWCPSKRKCVRKDSYTAVFPNGQCNEWITADCEAFKCSDHQSCDSCLTVPACGWCESFGTGSGSCKEGGAVMSSYLLSNMKCPRWYYTECPVCQCNGHSVCRKGTSYCLKCKNHTTGRYCEKCASGYYGDPRNGGTCQECQCNGHAKHCHHKTRKCECLVEGIIGDQCEKCDKERKYEGNATNGKLCYYKLLSRQRMVFNVSGKTSLNIQFSPTVTDQDINFEIKIVTGPKAFINLSYVQDISQFYSKQEVVFKQKKLMKNNKFSYKLSHREYKFRDHAIVVFQASIYKLDKYASFKIEAYFDQQSTLNINLLEFFLTFFGCFLSLLFVASVGWKIRSRYHSYLVTRQRRAERDRMANRPFATIHLLLPSDLEVLSKSSPNPVAMEPLAKNKVAVASVMVLLPPGEEGVTPVGQCGVCFGSMLMTHGNHLHTGIRSRMGNKKPKKRATMTTYHL